MAQNSQLLKNADRVGSLDVADVNSTSLVLKARKITISVKA